MTVKFFDHCASSLQRISPMLSNTAAFTSLFSSLYTDAILRKASVVFVTSDTSTYSEGKNEIFMWVQHVLQTIEADYVYGPFLFFTCCSISIALLAPNFSSLSGDGKLRKEPTSGGRVDGGVDTYKRNKKHFIKKKKKKNCIGQR